MYLSWLMKVCTEQKKAGSIDTLNGKIILIVRGQPILSFPDYKMQGLVMLLFIINIII